MKFNKSAAYFSFVFEPADYRKYGNINKFIDALKNAVPAHKRHYYPDEKKWEIHEDFRRDFDRLVSEYLTRDQLGLFD